MPRSFPAHAVLALAVATPSLARADALPPPRSCPSGEVWVRGHSGGCRPEAPDDCAPGWRGRIGGVCVVAVPDVGASPPCPSDEAAATVTLCLEKRLDHGNGRVHYDPPREYDATVGIVGPTAACEGPGRRATAGEVCVDVGQTPTAFVVPASDPPAPLNGPRVAGGGGCGRGCQAGPDAAAALLAGLAAVVSRVVSRRAPRRRPRA